MSANEKSYGGNVALEFESYFNNRAAGGNAQDSASWGTNAVPKSEGPLMSAGKGRPSQPIQGQPQPRPGQPPLGQRSIFGTGRGPTFSQVPTYTPVVRPTGPAPRVPEQQRQDYAPPQNYSTYARPGGTQPGSSGYANGQQPRETYQPQPRETYQPQPRETYQPQPRETYQPQNFSNPGYSHQPQPAPARPDQGYPPDPYSGLGQQSQPPAHQPDQSFASQPYQPQMPQAQAYRDQGFAADQSFPDKIFPESTYATDASFPDSDFQDASFPEQGGQDGGYAPQGFAGGSYPDQGYAADASFPDGGGDASFGDDQDHGGYAQGGMSQDSTLDSGAGHYGGDANFQAHHPAHGYAPEGQQRGQSSPSHQALQAFDAPYDQPPRVALGSTELPQQNFYEGEQADADFLDENDLPGEIVAAQGKKLGMGRRSIVMVSSALLGAVALGGALAFAYKQSGGSEGAPPLVQADSRPVKEAPQQPGGKEFQNKNKLIYERLQNGNEPEAERIVPRQEDVAMPAMPGAPAGEQTAGLPPGMAAAPGAAPGVATVDDPAGGPRRVKTLVVRPDGSVEAPPAQAAAPEGQPEMPPMPQQVAAAAQQPAAAAGGIPTPVPVMMTPAAAPAAAEAPPQAADPQAVAAIPAPVAAEQPAPPPQAAPPAAAEPKPARASQYVVQVGSKQNQTEALATFADMQQKYPSLLSSYRPIVQKADLGSKGVWYRLRIGPIGDKSTASKLCTQLKSQGLPDCLVVAAQ